jgi:hypothetical protein
MRSRRVLAVAAAVGLAAGGLCLGARTPPEPAASGPVRRAPRASAPLAPPADVHCEIAGDLREPVTLVEHHPESLAPLGVRELHRHGAWLEFTPVHAEGLGMLSVPGHAALGIGWLDGACVAAYTLVPLQTGTIAGQVSGVELDLDYYASACGRGAPVILGAFQLEVEPGACEVVVTAQFGRSTQSTAPVHVEVGAADVVDVRFAAPGFPREPGWDLHEREYGFYVAGVLRGGAADRAGIVLADRVLEIDGIPAADLAADDVVRPDDYPVTIVVDHGGEVRDRVLR